MLMSRELVQRAMRGDADAFGALAAGSIDRMAGTAGLVLRDRDAADDAVQEALVRAWRDLPGLRDPDRFEAWLYSIVVRACHDQLRRRRRDRLSQQDAMPSRSVASDAFRIVADRDELVTALDRLSAKQRTAVVLHYYVGLSHRQVAQVLGEPVGTVKARLSRSLDYLQAALAADARLGVREEGRA
jgi:RNA polymerase sigma-70 factor (sigma-E family)